MRDNRGPPTNSLPNSIQTVSCKNGIAADNAEVAAHGLRDHDAVEGVTVVSGEVHNGQCIVHVDVQK
jgi:hypothetical protein